MPRRRVRICSRPGCPTVLHGAATRCPVHAMPSRGRADRKASAHVLAARRCTICLRPFTEANPLRRGHVVSLEAGGSHAVDNWQAECRECSDARLAG
jgi:hypothetical protein